MSRRRRWRDYPIRRKLLYVVLFTSVLMLISTAIMYFMINSLITRLDTVYASNVNMAELRQNLDMVQQDLYQYLEVRDYDALSDYYVAAENFRGLTGQLSNQISDNRVFLLQKNIRSMSEDFLLYADNAITAKRGMNVEAYRQNYEKAMELYNFIYNDLAELNELLFQNNARSYETLQQAINYMEVASAILIVVIMVIGITVVVSTTRGIVAPLTQLSEAATRVGAGNLQQRIPETEAQDEVSIVTRAFNAMLDSLNLYIDKVREGAEKEQQMKEQELLMENHLKEAQLRFLQAQINPHFLFNSLNAGVQLAEMEDDEKTAVFLGKMADFFRYNVKKGTEDARIEEELSIVENYIYILNVRFAGEIIFTKEVDEGALNFRMPSMILQPLVENAVNHGIRDMIGEGWIRLTIQNDPDRVKIVIEDNGKGMDALQIQKIMERVETIHEDDSTGIGLDNVISRLSLYYDDLNVVEIVSPGENQGTKVILRLPKKET
ncbi:MAG: sensor histidine kinase [Lachnospiraceae bacterium]|nr:sensor histidine kinase [Lachnospiraceae bacterium]MBQ2503292.1 sensor histidine kinase [Lachnospiraceae bacterium]MBQ2579581.1 sensor histidine kinase [Lachnospiraceae bacterium]MBQ5386353.1 sensor histidine kinase [Lachnospiraceae bacterium]